MGFFREHGILYGNIDFTELKLVFKFIEWFYMKGRYIKVRQSGKIFSD